MDFKTSKDSKLLEFIKKHKTGLGVAAVILIVVIAVNIGINSGTSTKTSGSQNVYYAPDTNRNPAQSKPQTATESKSSATATNKDIVTSNIEADTWYVYKPLDLLKFQNCVVYQATAVGSKGIVVQYFSVCKKCHGIETNGEGLIRSAAPGPNYPIQKMYHCDNCGESTIVRLEIIQ